MPQFGKTSLEKLSTCHPDLQRLFNEVIKHYDCTIIEGHRLDEDQLKAFNAGKSKIKSGGKHNHSPSLAVDVAPHYPTEPNIDWNCQGNFYLFAGYVLATARQMKIEIKWGGSWNGSLDIRDNKFNDLVHFELLQ
jgi:peptidoglycan L-alanyl-D-glutamate endopeptidase CwlK